MRFLSPRSVIHHLMASGWTCMFCNYLNRPDATECESPMYCKGRGN